MIGTFKNTEWKINVIISCAQDVEIFFTMRDLRLINPIISIDQILMVKTAAACRYYNLEELTL